MVQQGESALNSGDYPTAVSDFETAHSLAPENLAAARGLVLSYLQIGRLTDAVELGSKATERWPNDAPLQHWLGLAYFKKKMNTLALQSLRHSEALDGSQFGTHFDIALVLLTNEQYAPAADELEQATKLKPSDALAHVLLGRAYQNSNRTLNAVEQFRTALRLDPKIALGHYHLGFAYASLGRDQEAIVEFKKELGNSSGNPSVLYHLGHSLLEVGNPAEALPYLKKAADLNPQDPSSAYDLGKALLMSDDAASAAGWLKRSIDLAPGDPTAHYQLARALDKLGQRDQAEQERQRFAELKKAQPQSGGMASGRSQ